MEAGLLTAHGINGMAFLACEDPSKIIVYRALIRRCEIERARLSKSQGIDTSNAIAESQR